MRLSHIHENRFNALLHIIEGAEEVAIGVPRGVGCFVQSVDIVGFARGRNVGNVAQSTRSPSKIKRFAYFIKEREVDDVPNEVLVYGFEFWNGLCVGINPFDRFGGQLVLRCCTTCE